MNTKYRNEVFAHFKLAKVLADPVIVSRVLPDNSLKPLGRIYQNMNEEVGSVTYISTDNNDEEIFPPTTDYLEAECGFEKYAKEVTQKSLIEDWEMKANEFAEREGDITKIRSGKNKNVKNQLINK